MTYDDDIEIDENEVDNLIPFSLDDEEEDFWLLDDDEPNEDFMLGLQHKSFEYKPSLFDRLKAFFW